MENNDKKLSVENLEVKDGKVIISSEELVQAMVNNDLQLTCDEEAAAINICGWPCGGGVPS